MIPKYKAPNLNRAMRRHPKRYRDMMLPRGSGMPWLLLGLLMRGGFMAAVGIKDMATGSVYQRRSMSGGPDIQNIPKAGGFLSKAKSFFRRMVGG